MELCPHIQRHLNQIDMLIISKLKAEDPRIFDRIAKYLQRGGKKLRPAICILSCAAAGGKHESVVETAAIIELVHNVTLIHDDIEDGSEFRRGGPTLHSTYGIPTAINSGDALYNFAWEWLLNLPFHSDRVLELQKRYSAYVKRMIRGQGIEFEWIRDDFFDMEESEYLGMVSDKTASLVEMACATGAFFAEADEKTSKALGRYGQLVGTAFQIQDDVLNVTGDFSRYRKEIGGDIREGKRTLMVVHCLQNGSDGERNRLKGILKLHTHRKEEVTEAIDILNACGSIDYAREFSKRLSGAAKGALEEIPDSEDRECLLRIADYVTSRDR